MKELINKYPQAFAITCSIAIAYIIGFASIYFFEEYGWTVFVLTPFLLGLLPHLIATKFTNFETDRYFRLGFITLGIFCLTTLLFALEGIICIIMASPILLIFNILGSLVAGYLSEKVLTKKHYSALFVLPVLFIATDTIIQTTEHLEVKTSIEIDAPIQVVWDNIVSFGQIDEPTELLFKTGISYPTHAEIKGHGVGAVRYCNFTTGSFVEPITVWDEPNLLKFDVLDQPTPMREMNPFWDVHPPHLDGYFQSKLGQFNLTELENGKVRVEGTTWYNIHIHPVQYWDFWSKYILHAIHFRVLEHIKKQSEAKN